MASLDDLFMGESQSGLAISASQTQDSFDEEFYEAVLQRNSKSLIVMRRLVELVARRGRYERALELNYRILAAAENDFIAYYNIACSHSMMGDLESGLSSLRQAVLAGYTDVAHLDADPDLDLLRADLRYYDVLGLLRDRQ